MELNRRELLIKSGSLGALSLLGSSLPFLDSIAYADTIYSAKSKEHLFFLIRIYNGMDVTLGLDPQVMPPDADNTDIFLEYRPEDIIKAEGLLLGPSAAPLKPFAKDCLIVNGMQVRRDAGHFVCLDYMSTGRGDGKAAVLPAEVGLATGFGPFGLATNMQAYTAGKKVMLTRTSELQAETNAGALSELLEERLKKFLPEGTPLEEAEKAVVLAKEASKELIASMDKIKKMTGAPLKSWEVLAAALQSGASQQAVIDEFSFNLDTHSSHEKVHMDSQLKAWTMVADIFSLFKKLPYLKGSLFDYTTFMVISEFSRTPALNAAKGKDHNPFTNSVLLAGKNIQGGKVIGKSRVIPKKKSKTGAPEHYAWPFNYKEGKLAESPVNASFFYPENLVKTIGRVIGNPAGFTPVSANVPEIPGIVKI